MTAMPDTPADRAKYASALGALEFVRPGMRLGLGTGSTAAFLVRLLGERMGDADLLCVSTSSRTEKLAQECGLNTASLEEAGRLDLTIDGADEFDAALNLVKGGGGALLQEKIVASASSRMVVIADESKSVETLGAFPLPVEVVRFGWKSTMEHIREQIAGEDVGGRAAALRMAGDNPFVTDEGHYIIDLSLERIGDAPGLAARLNNLPGVVETGLFIGIASAVVVGKTNGEFETCEPAPARQG